MTDETEQQAAPPSPLDTMRLPFVGGQISKLPKQSKNQTEQVKSDRTYGVNCTICGGWHHKNAVHLDYVGHAALTDRLLDADIAWSWEPFSVGADGLPALDRNGGLWIRLTVGGVTRIGYGSADGKNGGDAIKEIIGDALRNAGMRFGAALDLWHKGDLHADEPAEDRQQEQRRDTGRDTQSRERPRDEQREPTAAERQARMIAWVDKVKSNLQTFTSPDQFDALTLYEREIKHTLTDLRKANASLAVEVDEALKQATARTDEVPF